PTALTAAGTHLFLSADDGTSGVELWVVDNPSSAAHRARDINPGAADAAPLALTSVEGALLFSADNGINGRELWRSDGSEVGTLWSAKGAPENRAASAFPSSLVDFKGPVLFGADDGVHGAELWASGGDAASTRLVRDINPAGSAFPLFIDLL